MDFTSFDGKKLSLSEFDRICNFEPHTSKQNGLGLGLCIVRSIVERAMGEIRFTRKPVRGLIVEIHLPIHTNTPSDSP